MSVVIRLARRGRRNHPYYAVVVADSRFPRDGRFIEELGYYDPLLISDHPKRFVIRNTDRLNYWLSVGAEPSDRIKQMISK